MSKSSPGNFLMAVVAGIVVIGGFLILREPQSPRTRFHQSLTPGGTYTCRMARRDSDNFTTKNSHKGSITFILDLDNYRVKPHVEEHPQNQLGDPPNCQG